MRIEIDYTNHLLKNYYSREIKRIKKEIAQLQSKLHEKNVYIEEQDRTIMVLLNERDEYRSFCKKQQDIIHAQTSP